MAQPKQQPHHRLGQALLSVASLTFLSRILGLGRDIVIAATFAVGLSTDAFFTAFKIPNTLRRLTAEGAFTQAFVPVYNAERRQNGEQAIAILRNTMAGWLTIILMVTTIVGVLGAPVLVATLAPGFAAIPGKQEAASYLLRITFPYILLISLTAFGGAILNSYGKFAAFAFIPALLNLSLIGAALWLAPLFAVPITALAWGVVIGGLLQLGWQSIALWRHGSFPFPRLPRLTPPVKRIFKLTAQGALGVSIGQLGIIISLVFASFLEEGSVTWLYFADRMMELPVGMIGAALGVVALPALSWHAAQQDRTAFSGIMDWSLRLAVVLGLPAAGGLAILALPIAATIFQHGSYTATDSVQTALAITAYSVGIPALVAVRVLAAGFFARQEPLVAVKVSAIALTVTIILNFALVPFLRHAGLALAISLGATLNAGTLALLLVRRNLYQPQQTWLPLLLRITVAVMVMIAVLLALRGDIEGWTQASVGERILRLLTLVGAGAGTYFGVLLVTGWRISQLRPPSSSETSSS